MNTNKILSITSVVATLATSLLFTTGAHASALVQINEKTKTVTLTARMVYSGPALTEAIAQASTDEIQRMWNQNPTTISFNGGTYLVRFNVDYVVESRQTLNNPDSCAYNFISIQPKIDAGDRSFYYGLGSQMGVFYTSDGLGTSTTAAHEFGHGLVLDHNPLNQMDANIPGIMFARGTFVKAQYQYDSAATPGQKGGTLNPVHRQVRSEDIQDIPLSLVKMENSIGCLGNGKPLEIN